MKIHRIRFGRKTIKFAIKRTNRKKTIAISVGLDEGVKVRIPCRVAIKKVYPLIKKKAPWILKHLDDIKELSCPVIKHEFVSGESFSYLGRHYRLRVKKSKSASKPKILMTGGYLETTGNSALGKRKLTEAVRLALIEWYTKRAFVKLNERVSIYARKTGISRPTVMVRNQAKRWGSCSKTGILRFNWRIMMAPMTIVDYIVVHEIYHLKIKNHSSDFWKQVSLIIPEYERRRSWLRNNSGMFRW